MPKPRYDAQKDETRHGAVSDEVCQKMADKYGWDLKYAELTNIKILPVDCVFDGYCEFPPSDMDLTQGDYFTEENEDA